MVSKVLVLDWESICNVFWVHFKRGKPFRLFSREVREADAVPVPMAIRWDEE